MTWLRESLGSICAPTLNRVRACRCGDAIGNALPPPPCVELQAQASRRASPTSRTWHRQSRPLSTRTWQGRSISRCWSRDWATRAAGDQVESAGLVARLGTVHFTAPAAIGAALAKRMVERQSGDLVFIGSAAAFDSLSFAAAYSGTKAGMARFADALRLNVHPYNVAVTLVSPGFIVTVAGAAPLEFARSLWGSHCRRADGARGAAQAGPPCPALAIRAAAHVRSAFASTLARPPAAVARAGEVSLPVQTRAPSTRSSTA